MSKRIAGYVVLDENRPVARFDMGTYALYFPKHRNSKIPISVFQTQSVARRVKNSLRKRYLEQANEFTPGDVNLSVQERADHFRCRDLWTKRAEELRISAVAFDDGEAAR